MFPDKIINKTLYRGWIRGYHGGERLTLSLGVYSWLNNEVVVVATGIWGNAVGRW